MDFFSSVFGNQSELGDCDSQFCFFKQDEPSKQKDSSSSAFLALNSSQQIETSNPQDDFVLPISTQSQTNFMNNLFNQAPQPQTQESNNDAMNMLLNLNAGNILDNYNSVKNLFSSKNNNNNNTNNNNNNINGNINQNIHINISSQGSFPGVEIYTQRNEVIPENEHEQEEEDESNKNNCVINNGSGCNNVNEKFLFTNVNDASKGKQIMNDNKDNSTGLNELFGGFDNKKPNSKISNISSGSFGFVKKKVLDDDDEQEFIIKEKKIDNKQQQQNQIRNTYTSSNKPQNQITLTNQNIKRGNKQQQMQQNNQSIDNNSVNNTNDIFKQINPTIIQSSSNNNNSSDTNSINNNNNISNSTNIVNDYSKLQKLFSSKQSQTKNLKPLLSLFETLYITTEDFKHSFPFLLSSYLSAYSNTISQMNALIPIDDPEIDFLLTQCEHKLSHLSDKFSKI